MVLRTAVSVRTWAAIALAAIAALVLTTSTLSAQAGAGRVRVMHTSPDTPPVDIFVDGAKAVTGLAFPANTGYVSLPAGTHNVKVGIISVDYPIPVSVVTAIGTRDFRNKQPRALLRVCI